MCEHACTIARPGHSEGMVGGLPCSIWVCRENFVEGLRRATQKCTKGRHPLGMSAADYDSSKTAKVESEKKHPKKIPNKDFLPPLPPSRLFVFAFFPAFSREKHAEHKEFQGLKAPKRGWIKAWDSWWNLCVWVSFRPWKKSRSNAKRHQHCKRSLWEPVS